MGITETRPRLSWVLPPGATVQHAYELELDDGTTTGRVPSSDNVLAPWPGRPLTSRERREVRVRVWTDLGRSDWSDPSVVEAGLLAPDDWVAVWVSPAEGATAEPGFRPAHLLRGDLVVDHTVVRARLRSTAHGIHEVSLNGRRVGDEELAPGYTEYGERLQVSTHDVTHLVAPGPLTIGVVLADGWYRGQVGMLRAHDQWGRSTAVLVQLELDHADGSRTVTGTGPDWRSTASHIVAADLIEGQQEDRRLVDAGWDLPGADTSHWDVVTLADAGDARLIGPVAPPVRAVEELRPVSVASVAPGRQVVDLGQNINGRVRLSLPAVPDVEVTLVHGEWLGPDGDVTTDHLAPDVPFLPHPLRAGQVDRVVTSGSPDEVFEPRMTTHGFQYVRVEGLDALLDPDDITGIVVHTDLRRTGTFECSDARLERLHEAAVWGLRGNVCDIPTDCPTRERAGWTGDWHIFAPIASFLYDIAGFSTKWLHDLAVMQFDNGVLGNMAPMPPAEKTGFLRGLNGSAGWGDAIVLVPWELYEEYGDIRLLEEMWPAMTAWLEFGERSAAAARHPDRTAQRPEPEPYEQFLWDSGFHWGEWLVPGEDPSDFPAFMAADKSDVATAYLSHTAGVAARIAGLLGRADESEHWASLSQNALAAWRAEFIDDDGSVSPDTQANLVRALAFELVPEELRQQTADRLAGLVRANDNHLATGFLATPHLLPVLADTGHLDLAYDLLLQDTPPSWLAMTERGGTTLWERWEGVDTDGAPHESLNHYSKGAVIGFLHRYVAGLQRTEPTWRRFRVAPRPGGGLAWARAEHETPHGRAAVAWNLPGDGRLHVEVSVPPGCCADVLLPSGETHRAMPGTSRWVCAAAE